MAGLAEDVAGLVLEELKRDDGPRSVELRLGKAEQYAADPLLVIAPSVDKGRTKLDVYTQWGHECEGRKASGLSVDGALHLALADAQASGARDNALGQTMTCSRAPHGEECNDGSWTF